MRSRFHRETTIGKRQGTDQEKGMIAGAEKGLLPSAKQGSDFDSADKPMSAKARHASGGHHESGSVRSVRRFAQLPKGRIALLLLTGLAALLGLAGALVRANVTASLSAAVMPDNHGVLMVFGFLGTAISLERTVAYRGGGDGHAYWCFAAPLCGGLGTLTLLVFNAVSSVIHSTDLTNVGHTVAGTLWIASMAVLFAIYAALYRRQPSREVLMQLIAAFVGLVGVTLWLGNVDATVLAPMWLMFLVLTIVGERVELARAVFSKPHVENVVLGLCLATVPALIVQCLVPQVGYPLLGLGLAALMAYMVQHDVALGTWHNSGLTGFMDTCMLSAYAWGLVAAFVWLFAPIEAGGYWTDMGLHALALGFVMTMVIAHADVIIPSVTRRPMPFHPVLWVSWAMVQAGLTLRLAGTVRGTQTLWKAGDTVSDIGVLTMMVLDMGLVVFGRRILEMKRRHRSARSTVSDGAHHLDNYPARQDGPVPSIVTSAETSARSSSSVRALRPVALFCVAVFVSLALFAVYALMKPSRLNTGLVSGNGNGTSATMPASSKIGGSSSSGDDLSAGVSATGHTTTTKIGVKGMSFVPSSISLPAGNRLVVTFTNTGDQRHNLTFANGKQTGNVSVGAKATLDVGTIGKDNVAWCALAGHRQMGMELKVHAIGGKPETQGSGNASNSVGSGDASPGDAAVPAAAKLQDYARSATPFDATVPRDEFAGAPGTHERRYTFDIKERKEKVADGVTRTVWGYDERSHPRDRPVSR